MPEQKVIQTLIVMIGADFDGLNAGVGTGFGIRHGAHVNKSWQAMRLKSVSTVICVARKIDRTRLPVTAAQIKSPVRSHSGVRA